MKRTILITACLAGILALTAVSCSKEATVAESANDGDAALFRNPKLRAGEKKKNPYSLEIMQAALDSLMKTKSGAGGMLRPTDYYFRFSTEDTVSLVAAKYMPFMEVFDYPLDVDFDEETEFCNEVSEPVDTTIWHYSALSTDRAIEEVPYEDFLLAQAEGRTLSVSFLSDSVSVLAAELLDICYIPDHDPGTRAGNGLGISAEELEKKAFEIAGVPYEIEPSTKSSTYPAGYVYLQNGSSRIGVKGVKVRAQRLLKWSVGYTDSDGHFLLAKQFSSPNISIIFSNIHGFSVWGGWWLLSPASYTITRYSNPSSFSKTFKSNEEFAPWSWSVVNNAAYDYYVRCTQTNPRTFNGLLSPPSGMKLLCMNIGTNLGGGSTPMMNHILPWGTLFSLTSIISYFANIDIIVSLAVAAMLRRMAPDIIIVTHNKSYKKLYATTSHELSHASHYRVAGKTNYAKLILYELSYAFSDGYGPGGTGSEGEGMCELSETFAFSIENYILKYTFGDNDLNGIDSSFFFHNYVRVLTGIMRDGILTPGQVFSCITQNTGNMDTLLNSLCATYPAKATAINELMSTYGL